MGWIETENRFEFVGCEREDHRYWLEPKICIKCGMPHTLVIENCIDWMAKPSEWGYHEREPRQP